MKRLYTVLALLSLTVGLLLTGCGDNSGSTAQNTNAPASGTSTNK